MEDEVRRNQLGKVRNLDFILITSFNQQERKCWVWKFKLILGSWVESDSFSG